MRASCPKSKLECKEQFFQALMCEIVLVMSILQLFLEVNVKPMHFVFVFFSSRLFSCLVFISASELSIIRSLTCVYQCLVVLLNVIYL